MTTTTNSNLFRNQVRKYVLNAIEEPYTVHSTHEEFQNWYNHYEKRHQPNLQKAFAYWLMCLPTAMSVHYEDYRMEQTVQSWFENAGMEWRPKKNFDYSAYFLYLVSKEFFYLYVNPEKIQALQE